jgi:hypothetical protein
VRLKGRWLCARRGASAIGYLFDAIPTGVLRIGVLPRSYYYSPAYYPPVCNTYPQQTYPRQRVASPVAPRPDSNALPQTVAVGPPVPLRHLRQTLLAQGKVVPVGTTVRSPATTIPMFASVPRCGGLSRYGFSDSQGASHCACSADDFS